MLSLVSSTPSHDRQAAPDGPTGPAEALVDLFAPYFGGLRLELAIVAGFDRRGCLVSFSGACGSADGNGALITLVRAALQPASVASIVIAHNHPDGDPRPSGSDIAATRRVAALCRLANADLADHLLFTDGGVRGFRALGLL